MNPATYRNPSRICFDADQLQRHRRLSYMLQQADCLAGELLLMLRRLHRNPRHCRQVRAEIVAVAQWMNFLTEECEYIITETAERRPDGVTLSWGVLCKGAERKPPPQHAAAGEQMPTNICNQILAGEHNSSFCLPAPREWRLTSSSRAAVHLI